MIRHALVLGTAALALGTGGASGAGGAAAVLALTGPVKELAADGGRVAILLQTSRPRCTRDRVAVWAPSPRTLVPIAAAPCSQSLSTGAGYYSVALAGTRVAFVAFVGGNRRELRLRLATLAKPRPVTAASASFSLDEAAGTYIGRVAGRGSQLAFDWWSVCLPCAQASPIGARSSVWRIVPSGAACPQAGLGTLPRCQLVVTRPGALRLLAVGSGLLALRATDGSLVLTTPAGAVRATIPFPPGQLRAARIDGNGRTVVALVSAGGRNTLRVFDPNGTPGATLPLPATKTAGDGACVDPTGCLIPALRLEDLQSGLAVYVVGRDVHVLRLADGHEVRIRTPGSSSVHAQLEAPGLFYSYRPATGPGLARVAFLPFASLLARFG